MARQYMPIKFPIELRPLLAQKQSEMQNTWTEMSRRPRRIPFTKVLKAVLENKTYIPNDYLVKIMREK